MSIWDQCKETLSPYADRLNETIAATGMVLHNRLEAIEAAVSNMGRPGFGDHYYRIPFKKKLAPTEELELGECPLNEVWKIEAIVVDGVQNKSPAFIFFVDDEGKLIESVIAEGIGHEGVSGDTVVLPGETLKIKVRAEGTVAGTVHIVRIKIPTRPMYRQAAAAPRLLEGFNVHEQSRDVIAAPDPRVWAENPQETRDQEKKEKEVGEMGSERSTIRR